MKASTPSTKLRAIYPGSFDPVTNGHLDILDRSLAVFDHVIVLVAESIHKDPLFGVEERAEILREVLEGRKGVEVKTWGGLTMDYAKKEGIHVVIRGLRAASDFEYEFMMAAMNKQIHSDVETLFMMSSQEAYFVSSSMVKELHRYGGDLSPYVPKQVVKRLTKKKGLK